MVSGQTHENDLAKMIVVCAPTMQSKMMGALHPAGALYEKPVNLDRAVEAHAQFVSMLRRSGAEVRDVRDILCQNVSWSVGDRIELEEFAARCLKYVFDNRSPDEQCEVCDPGAVPASRKSTDAEQYYVSDEYKMLVIRAMGEQQLVDIVLTNPRVTLAPSLRDTGLMAKYAFDPMSNIIFVRDQQITTRKGIVMARLRSPQRQLEVDIMNFCFRKLGLNVVGRVPAPGHLEGGDFFPAGDKLAFIGLGPRSDWPAVEYLLREDLIGTERVAVVKDERERKQERMHLDTVFNIISDDCVIMLQEMMGEESPTHRVVDEYVKSSSFGEAPEVQGDAKAVGQYRLARGNIEFSKYVRECGFAIIEISGEEQLKYGCNILNLGGGHIISIEADTARRIASSPLFKGKVELLDFSDVTTMYGGVHCASQIVKRQPVETGYVRRYEEPVQNGTAYEQKRH